MSRDTRLKQGPLSGFPIGLLVLDTRHRLVLGNLQNAGTFPFPILYHVVQGVSGAELMSGNPSAAEPIIAGARSLEKSGVQLIAGACGSFVNYQQEVAAAVNIPVVMSILLEVPVWLRSLPPSKKLGIVFASTSSFTHRVRIQCGIEATDRIVIVGADDIQAFRPIIEQQDDYDDTELRQALVNLTRDTLTEHPEIGAWLIQCSDFPPYSCAIATATGLPVFDMVGLIGRLHSALVPRTWS